MKHKLLRSIKKPSLIKNIFNFVGNKKKLQIIKYSKKYQKILGIYIKDYKNFFP